MPESSSNRKGQTPEVLHRWDLIFFSVCALVGLDAVAGLAKAGLWESITWFIIFIVIYICRTAWSRRSRCGLPGRRRHLHLGAHAYGKLAGGISAILYWIANPIWIGGTLAAVSIAAINSFFMEPNGHADLAGCRRRSSPHLVWLNIGDRRRRAQSTASGRATSAPTSSHRGDLLQRPGGRLLIKKGMPAGHAPLGGLKPASPASWP